jgi:hypothetical protein
MCRKTRFATLALASLLLAAGGCERWETVESAYPDHAAAAAAGALGEGRWIPALLPRSATDIREAHDLDTNEVRLRFRFAAADLAAMVAACSPVPPDEAARARRPLVAWWPAALTEGGRESGTALPDFGLHRCADGSLAVDRERREAFFWSAG